MRDKLAGFLALFFMGLMLGPSLAHLFEFSNKMRLAGDHYVTVQQIYQGRSLAGVLVVGTLLIIMAQAMLLRGDVRARRWTLLAAGCIVAGQVVLWSLTFSVNRATESWTSLPENWTALRRRWEYAHAAAAILNVVAYSALIVSLLIRLRPPVRPAHP